MDIFLSLLNPFRLGFFGSFQTGKGGQLHRDVQTAATFQNFSTTSENHQKLLQKVLKKQ